MAKTTIVEVDKRDVLDEDSARTLINELMTFDTSFFARKIHADQWEIEYQQDEERIVPTEWEQVAAADAYCTATAAINARIAQAVALVIGEPVDQLEVFYSAGSLDADNNPIDNLDEAAVKGKVVLSLQNDDWTEEKTELSEPMTDPTWLDVAVFCDVAIRKIGMGDHRFLENVYCTGGVRAGQFPIWRLSMGS